LVVVDREQGGRERLEAMGIGVNCLARISELVAALYSLERISEEQMNGVKAYIAKQYT